jgi:hypothetical protein
MEQALGGGSEKSMTNRTAGASNAAHNRDFRDPPPYFRLGWQGADSRRKPVSAGGRNG